MKSLATIKQWGDTIGIIAAIALIISFHRDDRQMLIRHDQTLAKWEMHGTPSLVQKQATYDEHFRASDARLDKLEAAFNSLYDIKVKLEGVSATLAELKVSLEEHKRQTKP